MLVTQNKDSNQPYPSPQQTGGVLIRRMVKAFREIQKANPQKFHQDSHILCAVSGGIDSTAMGVLLAKYGRRIASQKNITFLHINHGWRGKESDQDEAFVRGLAKRLGVRCVVRRLKPLGTKKVKGSLEDQARRARLQIYKDMAKKGNLWVATGHHLDDRVETALWRLFSGDMHLTKEGAILPFYEPQIRLLLNTRKAELAEFLREEKISPREDRTNFEGRFLRSKMRTDLLPAIERIFPNAVESVARFVDQTARK